MEWINVKDRLPKDEVPVLVAYIGINDRKLYADGMANIRYGGWCWYEDYYGDNDEKVAVTITHWMPLPEPPEED